MHPQVALFVAPSANSRGLKSFIFRISAFAPADPVLYIHASLIRAGVLDHGPAKMLSNAINIFNSYTGGKAGAAIGGSRCVTHLGMAEVQSVCKLAAALRRARSAQVGDENVDDKAITCEAWLLAVSGILDASIERELLWQCTLLSFGRAHNFKEYEPTFRQNLFGDTLMSQGIGKKDLNARFYDRLADILKQKYSFDFFNPQIVRKCLATTQALMAGRDVAVLGEAGVGKTDCVVTLLEAGRDFLDDAGQPFFRDVSVLRVNTLAHNVRQIIQVVSQAAASKRERARKAHANPVAAPTGASTRDCTWLALDGPLDPALLESVAAAAPLHVLDSEPVLPAPLPLRVLVETDQLWGASPALISALAVTFIDRHRGPTWKDRAIGWAHQLALSCPEYAPLIAPIQELLVQLLDSILAFVLYYFHAVPRDDSTAMSASAEADVANLDYMHQTTCFLSFFTTLVMDPVIEKHLFTAADEAATDSGAIERQVRLLIGMASISSFGSSLLTHQRPRFERYVREHVLDKSHGESLPPLYDLYFDSKTGTFQAVNEIVRLTEPILGEQSLCVATEEFVAFQLRLRRLLAIDAPVLLAGTAGSGKSTLLRYLLGSPSPALQFVLFRTSASSQVPHLQAALQRQLRMQHRGGFWAPSPGKRVVLLVDDLHLGGQSLVGGAMGLQGAGGRGAASGGTSLFGGYSVLAEWMRFALEQRGFYNARDNTFLAVRDASFLPSLLSPGSHRLQVCKRFSRHFFVVFMEIPSQASIEKIFSTMLNMNLMPVLPADGQGPPVQAPPAQEGGGRHRRSSRSGPVRQEGTRTELVAAILEATLGVCREADLAARQRLHGLARVFWDVSHTFALVPSKDLRSVVEVGYLWAFAMRSSVLDGFLEQGYRRRHVYNAVLKGCATSFGLVVAGRSAGEEERLDPDVQAAALDSLAYMYQRGIGGQDALWLQRLPPERACSAMLQQLSRRPAAADAGAGEGGAQADGAAADLVGAKPCLEATAVLDELLCDDGMAGLMWMNDSTLLCTLLRLCHTMYLHPLVCLVGGWAHLPLLMLASRLFGGEGVRFCTGTSMEALEEELLHEPPSRGWMDEVEPTDGGGGGGSGSVSRTGSSSGSHAGAAAAAPIQALTETGAAHGQPLRVLAIGEEDVPHGTPSVFLDRVQQRYFKPLVPLGPHGAPAGGGSPSQQPSSSTPGRHPSASTTPSAPPPRVCLVILCRSAASFQALAIRYPFVQQAVSAVVVLPTAVALQKVASAYLPMRLGGVVSYASLPKQRRLLAVKEKQDKHGRSRAFSNMVSRHKMGSSQPSLVSDARANASVEHTLFAPLAQATEAVHVRVAQCLANEYGKDFAMDFCTPYRYAQFLQTLVRLGRQLSMGRAELIQEYSSAMRAIDRMQALGEALDRELREVRVSLRLLVEEAGRLTARVARVDGERRAAEATLAKTRQRQQALEARVATVDAKYGASLSKARAQEAAALRDLGRLQAKCFEDLGNYLHPPEPIVRTLEVMHMVGTYLEQLGDDTGDRDPHNFRPPADLSAIIHTAADDTTEGGDLKISGKRRPVSRKEVGHWAQLVGTKDLVPALQRWPSDRLLPPWMAVILERFVSDPDCHPRALHQMNAAASHMASWLVARVECHKVLEQVETKRQSLGDLSQQMAILAAEVAAGKADLARAERELEDLRVRHTEAVKRREEKTKGERTLEERVKRVRFALSAYTLRRREYSSQLQALAGNEDAPEQWGGLLLTGMLCVYGAAFGPAVRMALTRETQQVLLECDIPAPRDILADPFLKGLLPASFLQFTQAFWQDRYMYESIAAAELSSSPCAVVLDPFDLALPWLRELHTQSYPSVAPARAHARTAGLEPASPHGAARARAVTPEEAELPPPWENRACGEGAGRKEPTVLWGGERTEVVLDHLARCVRENGVLVVQVRSPEQLRGLVGALVVLLQAAEAGASLRSGAASAPLPARQRGSARPTAAANGNPCSAGTRSVASQDDVGLIASEDAAAVVAAAGVGDEGTRIQMFSLLQRLQHALPLPHRRFRLYVLVPWCPWNCPLWGPARQKRAEQISVLPAMLWSTCTVVSLDPRPVHPAALFLPVFDEARDASAAASALAARRRLAAQRARLHAVEEILRTLLVHADPLMLDNEALHLDVRRFHASGARLAAEVAAGLQRQRGVLGESRARHLQLAGTVTVLLCALMDGEVAQSSAGHGKGPGDRIDVQVDGFAMRPCVMATLLLHQLRCSPGPEAAVSSLLELVMLAAGARQAAVLRVLLALESRLAADRRVQEIWAAAVPRSAGGGGFGLKDELTAREPGGGPTQPSSALGRTPSVAGGEQRAGSATSREEEHAGSSTRPSPEGAGRGGATSAQSDEIYDPHNPQPSSSSSDAGPGVVATSTIRSASASPAASQSISPSQGVENEGSEEEGDEEESRSSRSPSTVDDRVVEDAEDEDVDMQDIVEREGDDQSEGAGTLASPSHNAHQRAAGLAQHAAELAGLADTLLPPLRRGWDGGPRAALRRLPADVALVVPYSALPVLGRVAEQVGVELREESAASIKDRGLAAHLSEAFAGTGTWLLLDLADVADFGELATVLRRLLQGSFRRLPPPPPAPGGRQLLAAARGRVAFADLCGDGRLAPPEPLLDDPAVGAPSRLILFSSADATCVPRHVLQLCLCVQSVVQFFGVRPAAPEEDDSVGSDEAGDGAFSEDDDRASEGGGSNGSSHQSGGAHHDQFAEVARDKESQLLLDEVLGYLSHVHPLLSAKPLSVYDERLADLLAGLASGFHGRAAKIREVLRCRMQRVPEWVHDKVLVYAWKWVQENSICAMLHSFSPLLVQHGDKEVKETLNVLSGKLCTMLQRVWASISMLVASSPFWLRLELHRTAAGLRAARADLLACYGALCGDAHWNPHLLEVYKGVSGGRALWADGRPLASWLESVKDHVAFLVEWQQGVPTDSAPFRLGSISSVRSFLSSYSHDIGRFHLRLEPRGDPARQRKTSLQLAAQRGGPVEALHPGHRSQRRSQLTPTGVASVLAGLSVEAGGRDRDSGGHMLVERLHLLGATWEGNRLASPTPGAPHQVELPPMIVRPFHGPAPKSSRWFACPLVIASEDAYGEDLAAPPMAHVLVRTGVDPALCTLRGVRLVSYA